MFEFNQQFVESKTINKTYIFLFYLFILLCIFREVRLTPVTVDGEVSILRELCGDNEDSTVLERLEYFGKY